MNFDFKLDPRLEASIQRLGFSTPTPIQTQAIPPALEGRDLVGSAMTGTGKTLAFALPILQRLLSQPLHLPGKSRAFILAPTRELAQQIHDTFQRLLPGLPLRSATVFGGVGFGPQQAALRQGVPIVVACLDRLLDLSRDFAPVWGIDAELNFVGRGGRPKSGCWWLVIADHSDEADALGYHDLSSEGLPLGKVFAATDFQANKSWTVTASHEALEMLADPDVNLSAFVQNSDQSGILYAYEVCDLL